MGHDLSFSKEGLKIDHDKAKAGLDMPRPEDVEGVQRLNGFVNYSAKFLPRLADHMEPIRRLTRQDTDFNWTEEQENAFREVKQLVTLHRSSAITIPKWSSRSNVMLARQASEQPSCKEVDQLHSLKPSDDMHRLKKKCSQSSFHSRNSINTPMDAM